MMQEMLCLHTENVLNIDKAKGCLYNKGCCSRFRGLVGKTFIDGFYFLSESVLLLAMPSLLK